VSRRPSRFPVLPALAGISALVLVAVWSFTRGGGPLPEARRPAPSPAPAPVVEESEEAAEDPAARTRWETMRLADPATGRVPDDMRQRELAFAAQLPDWERGSAAGHLPGASGADKLVGWTHRGPWNIGGRTRALAFDVGDPLHRTLLAGGISGGMWRTTDDGAHWNLVIGSTALHSVTCVAQDVRAGHQQDWYYGTGELRGNSATGGGASFCGDGIFKSVDGGLTWSQLAATDGGSGTSFTGEWQYVHRLAVDRSAGGAGRIYAAVYGYIERSLDGGATWTRVLGSASPQADWTDVIVSSAGVVYASLASSGGTRGVYRSSDGVTWTNITPAGLVSHGRIVLALAPSDENLLYALVSDVNGTSNEGLYRYTYLGGDGSGAGGSWSDRSAQLAALPGPSGSVALECYTNYCQSLTVNPADPAIVYVGGMQLFRSTDGFATNNLDAMIGGWQYSGHHADLHCLEFVPGSATVAYTGSDGGVHKTLNVNAASPVWSSLGNGYNTSQFYTVALDANLAGSDVVIGGMQDNGTWFTGTTDGAQPWVELLGGDGAYCAVASAAGATGRYVVSVQNGVVYRMEVDNLTGEWLTWTRVDPTGGGGYLFINPLIVDPVDTRQLWIGTSAGVWRNSNLTAIPLWQSGTTSLNWTHVTSTPSAAVTALAMTTGSDRTLYYGTSTGRVFRLDHANTAPASSVPALLATPAGWPVGAYVSDLAINPADPACLLVSLSNYNVSSLFLSRDGGATWTAVEGNLGGADGPSVRSVAILPRGAATIWLAATSTGLYSTFVLDGAATVWSREAPDLLGNVVVDQVRSRALDGVIVAGSHGRGVYGLHLPAATAVGAEVPSGRLTLAQNVPNPLNPRTEIAFSLAAAGPVSLDVFDLGGRHVRTLVSATLAAGGHTVTWHGDDDAGRPVGSGVYTYRLRQGGTELTRQLTVVR
jgi:hypothetical protein